MARTYSRLSNIAAAQDMFINAMVIGLSFARAGRNPVPCYAMALYYIFLQQILLTTRYLNPRIPIPVSVDWRVRVLEQYADKDFKIYMRMTKAQFNTLVDLIKDHFVFAHSVGRPQEPIKEQLKLCLFRLGAKGVSMDRSAAALGFSKGSAENYFWRCISAICALAPRFIQWPDNARRRVIKARFKEKCGLSQVIDSVDGVHLPYDCAPHLESEVWNTYKCRYALGATAVCDHDLRFTFFKAGHVGSAHDSTSFKRSELYLRSNILFSGDEYLLGDKGYSLLPILMTPFKNNEVVTPSRKNYNRQHKYGRSLIENAFGQLKNKFQALKCLSVDVAHENDINAVSNMALACATLHNFLLAHPGDKLDEPPRSMFNRTWLRRAPEEPIVVHNPKQDRRAGVAKRNMIVSIVARYKPY